MAPGGKGKLLELGFSRVFTCAHRAQLPLRLGIFPLLGVTLLSIITLQVTPEVAYTTDFIEVVKRTNVDEGKGDAQGSEVDEELSSSDPMGNEEGEVFTIVRSAVLQPSPDSVPDDRKPEAVATSSDVDVATKEMAPEPKELTLPLKEGTLYLEAFDELEYDRANKKVRLLGNALMVFSDIQVEAELIEIDDIAKSAYLKGKVAMVQRDDVIYADEGYLSYDSGEFELVNVSGNTSGTEIRGTLYFKAQTARGNFDDFEMYRVWMTTCPPWCKVYEYELTAKKARVLKDKVVHIYRVYGYVRGRKVLFLPQLSLPLKRYRPLRQTESPIQQNLGYNQTEGFFSKFAYTYDTRYLESVAPALLGVLKLDLTEKQGTGFGIRQDFFTPLGVTNTRFFYQRQNRGALNVETGERAKPDQNYELALQQELGLGPLKGSLSVNRENRYRIFRSRSNTLRSNLNLSYSGKKFTTSISGNQSLNITGGYKTEDGNEVPLSKDTTGSLSLNHSYRISPRASLSVQESAQTRKRNDGKPSDIEGRFVSSFRYTRPDYTLNLAYEEQAIDLDGDRFTGDDRYSVRSIKPGLELTFPKSAFGKNSFVDRLAINLDNITDKLRDQEELGSVFRLKADTSFSKELSGPPARLYSTVGFAQHMYDDGNAQYILRPNLRFNYTKGDWFKFDFNWDRTVQHGVKNPPVRSEVVRSRNNTTFGMEFIGSPIIRLGLRSSYDLMNKRWGNLNINTDYDPEENWGVTLSTSYNVENSSWSPLTSRWEFHSPADNWYFRVNMTTNIFDKYYNQRLDWTYSRTYKRGWRFYIYSAETKQGKGAFLDRVQIQKRNTCTTLNFGFIGDRKEYYFSVFINAFPRYPVEARGRETATGWDFWVNTPTGDIFDIRRGLTGGWGGYSGYPGYSTYTPTTPGTSFGLQTPDFGQSTFFQPTYAPTF